MKLLERLRLQEQIKNMAATSSSVGGSPKLEKELKETQKQLNSILNEWKWDGKYPKSANEFLNKFKPWINKQLEAEKELKVFLSKWGSTSLGQLGTTWNNTEQDYQKQIKELRKKGTAELSEDLKEKLKNYEDLEAEKDELARDKKTLEQEVLAINNRLKLKAQEVNNKDEEIKRIKKEASEKGKEWEKKYKQKVKLLDEEQTAMAKLENKTEELTEKNKELDRQNAKLAEELLKLSPGNVNL